MTQIESQFTDVGVTNDKTKYNAAISVLSQISDIILSSPVDNMYLWITYIIDMVLGKLCRLETKGFWRI